MTIPPLSPWASAQVTPLSDNSVRLPRRSADLGASATGPAAGAPTHAGPYTNFTTTPLDAGGFTNGLPIAGLPHPPVPGDGLPNQPVPGDGEEGVAGGRGTAPPMGLPVAEQPIVPGIGYSPTGDVVWFAGPLTYAGPYTNLPAPQSNTNIGLTAPAADGPFTNGLPTSGLPAPPTPAAGEDGVVGGRGRPPESVITGPTVPAPPPSNAGPYTNLPTIPTPDSPGAGISGGPTLLPSDAGYANLVPPAGPAETTLPGEGVVGGRGTAPPQVALQPEPPSVVPPGADVVSGDGVKGTPGDGTSNAPPAYSGPFTNTPPSIAAPQYASNAATQFVSTVLGSLFSSRS